MYLVTFNPRRELMHLAYVGQVTRDDAKHCRAEIEALLPTLKPGFRLLTDLSALEEMDYACADDIRAMMDELRKCGISRVIRVIPDQKKDIGFTVMSYFHYGRNVKVQTVESLAEALKALESWSPSL
jgi:hypothetical protein